MEGKIEERSLPVTLTDHELLVKAKELAKAQGDVATLEDQAKSAAAMFKDKTAMQKANINILSRAISNGYEYRDVRCRWDYEWSAGVKKLVRLDTLEVVRTYVIQEGERQQKLPVDGAVSYTLDKEKPAREEGEESPTVECDGKYAGDLVYPSVCITCDWPECDKKESA